MRLVFLFLLLLYSIDLFAGDAYHGANFIKEKVGARPISLGVSYLSFVDDPYSLFYNPAGLLNYDSSLTLGGGYEEYQNIVTFGGLSIINEDFGLGFGGIYKKYQDLKKYDYSGSEVGNVKNNNLTGIFGFSTSITSFSTLGLSFKFGYQTIDSNRYYALATSLGLNASVLFFQLTFGLSDIGINYQKNYKKYNFINPQFHFGLSYINKNQDNEKVFGVGFAVKRGVDIPTEETHIGIGSFIRLFSSTPELFEVISREKKVTTPNSFYLNIGIESYHGINFSLGFSLILWGIQIDYAITFPTKDKREFSHYVTGSVKF